jgi:hypothetical protein
MLLPMYRLTYVLPLQDVWIFQGETEIDDHSTISLVHGALNHTCVSDTKNARLRVFIYEGREQ